MEETAELHGNFWDARRQHIPDSTVHDLAEAMGDGGAWELVKDWAEGKAYNAEQVRALRMALKTTGQKCVELSKNNGDWKAVRDFEVERERFVMLARTVSGATAEAGRALRAFHDIGDSGDLRAIEKIFKQNTGRTLFQTRMEMDLLSKLDTEEGRLNFLRQTDKPKFYRYILQYWLNNLIGGIITHATYTVGNETLAVYRAIPETTARAIVAKAMKAAGRGAAPEDVVQLGEAVAQAKGFFEGLAPALKGAVGGWRTGQSTLLRQENMRNLPGFNPDQKFSMAEKMDPSYKAAQILPDAFAAMRSMKEALATFHVTLQKGLDGEPIYTLFDPRKWETVSSPHGVTPDIAFKGGDIVVPFGTAISTPGRMVSAIHSFHRIQFHMMEISAEAYRKAAAEGLTGEAFDQRVAELKKNPELEMIIRANKEATGGTLMDKGGAFTRALAHLTNQEILGLPLAKFVDPFVKITGNVLDQAILQRSVAGIFDPDIRADLLGKNGAYAQDRAIGRMMMGTALSVAVAGYVMEGRMTGAPPTSRAEKENWARIGKKEYSVLLGDRWVSYHRLGVLGLLMGFSADMYQVAKHATAGELEEVGSALLQAFTHNILEESSMRGPSELVHALESDGRFLPNYLRNMAATFVPGTSFFGQITRAVDPYSRKTETLLDALKAKYWWWSQEMLPRRDLWGEPVENWEPTMGTALYASRVKNDPVDLEMYRLNVHKAPVSKTIRNIKLNAQQYDDYQRIAGRMAKMQLDKIVKSDSYSRMPDFVKMDTIERAIDDQRKTAAEKILHMYPELAHAAHVLKNHRQPDGDMTIH